MNSDDETRPTLTHALVCFLGMLAWIGTGIFYLEAGLHGVLLIGLCWVVANIFYLGFDYARIRQAILMGIQRALPALLIFILIGVVIATFIGSGTVGTLIYYGLKFLHPAIFLPAGLILCSLMSLATGTSWGTIGTGGIVLISVGAAMGMPLPIVAGMIISGACFGDKMSPVSDTTNLAALSAGTDLYDHIRSMLYTTVPSYLITLALFTWIGLDYTNQTLPEADLQVLLGGLEATYTINVFMLLPMVVLMVLAMKRVAPEAAMMAAGLVAALLAIFVQGQGVAEVVTSFYDGAKANTNIETLDVLLNRGGITDMAWTFMLSMIAIALGALLEAFGFLAVLVEALLRSLKRPASLVTAAIGTAFAGNLALGESYIAIILGGQLFKDSFDDAEIDRSVLSRSLEEGSTLTTGLVPWTTSGAFYAATLGVATLDYIQWSFLNWINPLIGILFAWIGIALFRTRRDSTAEQPA